MLKYSTRRGLIIICLVKNPNDNEGSKTEQTHRKVVLFTKLLIDLLLR